MNLPAKAVATLLLTGSPLEAKEAQPVIVYDDVATQLEAADEKSNQLWIATADLLRSTGFELKPQGVCRKELCFALPKAKRAELVQKKAGKTWLNLTGFAELVHQPVAREAPRSIWYFGQRSDQRQASASAQAPDFKLPDIDGKPHSLSDFRGKKVLLVTWASW